MVRAINPNDHYTVNPITPNEVIKTKKNFIPREVIESFNELIAKNFHNGRSNFLQKEVVKLIIEKLSGSYTDQNIFDNHWLDVEEIYRKAGWKVKYDAPAYCENYEASFEFSVDK